MLYVVRVTRPAVRNARVHLTDGRRVLVPLRLAKWGTEVREGDVVEVSVSYKKDFWHVDLLKKGKSIQKDFFRDFEGFNAEREINLIRSCVKDTYRSVFGGFWASDQLDDFTLEIFMHLWERDCFRRWDDSLGSYEAYVRSAVRNGLIDIARNATVQLFRRAVSLNAPVSGEDGESQDSLLDMLPSLTNQDVVEQLQAEALLRAMNARVLELDCVGTGLYGLTYKAIFDSLVTNSLNDLKGSAGYGSDVFNFHVSRLREELSVVWDAWAV
jgi:DNA-directed RNA polymerase specialized sigma24 family protein